MIAQIKMYINDQVDIIKVNRFTNNSYWFVKNGDFVTAMQFKSLDSLQGYLMQTYNPDLLITTQVQ